MSDISNDDMLTFHLATFEEDAIMEEPVGSNQKRVFLEYVQFTPPLEDMHMMKVEQSFYYLEETLKDPPVLG